MPLPAFLTRRKENPMPEHTTTTAAWSEGVVLRYLTVGGATVDVYEPTRGEIPTGQYIRCNTVCRGCGQNSGEEYDFNPENKAPGAPYGRECVEHRAGTEASKWAQEHSEKCRALPRPAA